MHFSRTGQQRLYLTSTLGRYMWGHSRINTSHNSLRVRSQKMNSNMYQQTTQWQKVHCLSFCNKQVSMAYTNPGPDLLVALYNFFLSPSCVKERTCTQERFLNKLLLEIYGLNVCVTYFLPQIWALHLCRHGGWQLCALQLLSPCNQQASWELCSFLTTSNVPGQMI